MANILLVEDQDDLRTIYTRLLENAGHRVTAAANGNEALDVLPQSSPDVMLLDLEMPDMDGLATLRELRRREATGEAPSQDALPVVFLTSHAHPEEVEKGLDAGALAYIVKPIDPKDLIDELSLVLTSGEF